MSPASTMPMETGIWFASSLLNNLGAEIAEYVE